ncbi:Hypp3132 [Branchiostoma lanceolatum]|uniref:Hypp3132 protein n=1 Tax=Branchiostoma lanceolatum TaxID=7740 RepID=A0A8K0ET85_BRALA|nr:Hypp3132 [Branchiostoma lanceolatum]
MHEDPRRPDYALGRVIGTISAVDGSLGLLPEFNRMLWWQGPQWLSPGPPSVSAEKNLNVSDYCNAPFYVDIENSKVVVDLSNSLPTNPEELFAPKEDDLKKQVPIPFCVLDICSVIEGIKYIVGEGEGSDPCNPFFKGELSHYYKFKEIWKGRKLKERANSDSAADEDPSFPLCGKERCQKNYSFSGDKIPFQEEGVWPTVMNPNTSKYPQGSLVRILSDSFNQKYTNLMNCLHKVYNGNPGLFLQCYSLMTSLTVDAKRLVQTPIYPGGPHGAPTFE